MRTFQQDLRYAVRIFCQRPAHTTLIVLTLAVGIGANSAVFSVVDAVLLRPLPYADPERLARIYENNQAMGFNRIPTSFQNFTDWRAQAQVFEEMAAYQNQSANLTGGSEPRHVLLTMCSPTLFRVFQAGPALGRTLLPDDDLPGNGGVAVLSHRFWQEYFGGDAAIVGKTIRVNGIGCSIVGIMPSTFRFPNVNVDLWQPMPRNGESLGDRRRHFASAVGRLRAGTSLDGAQAEMSTIADRLASVYPASNKGWEVTVVPLREAMVSDIRAVLLILWAAVGFVLLIACSNVANLLLAHAAAREKEVAIRSAIGASRGRLLVQLVTEGTILGAASGAAGLLLAFEGIEVLKSIAADSLPQVDAIALDWRVVAFTSAISITTGILTGLFPALQLLRSGLNPSLQAGGRSSVTGVRGGVRSLLVASEVAMALVLLIGANLVIFSFIKLWIADAGFDSENLLTCRYALPMADYPTRDKCSTFHDQLVERVGSLPGVVSAGVTLHLPLAGNWENNNFVVEGRSATETGAMTAMFRYVSAGYLPTMGIPILKGRSLAQADRRDSENVAIISKAMAARYWPAEDPVGLRIAAGTTAGPSATWRRIVGVAGDAPSISLGVSEPVIYVPQSQASPTLLSMSLAVRVKTDYASTATAIRAEMASLDGNVPIYNLMSMNQLRGDSVAQRRFVMLLLGLFAAMALALSLIGIYGTISYAVRQRRHEIGVRMAIGARPRDVLRMSMGQGFRLTAIGLAAGLAGAFALTRYLKSLLFGVTETDPVMFILIPILLLVVAMLASYLPARRAATLDPIAALRQD